MLHVKVNGSKILARYKELGYKQKDVSRLIHRPPRMIIEWVDDGIVTKIEDLFRIAKILKMPISEFVDDPKELEKVKPHLDGYKALFGSWK